MTTSMAPNLGPEMATAYQPGSPGGRWTDELVLATRLRVLQMIHPEWEVKKAQGTWNGVGVKTEKGQVTENTLMRLVFHDCMRYTDGSGGCDGCIIELLALHHERPLVGVLLVRVAVDLLVLLLECRHQGREELVVALEIGRASCRERV